MSVNFKTKMLVVTITILGTACQKQDNSQLSKDRIAARIASSKNTDPEKIVETFDLTKEVSWSADSSKEKFTGLALSIPLKAIDATSVTMTMLLKKNTSLTTPTYGLSVTGDQKIASSITLVLPSAVADGFLLVGTAETLVKFTSEATGLSRYLAKTEFSKLANGIVVSVSEWGIIAPEILSSYVAMGITSPIASSYINAGNVSNFAVTGTCEIDGSTIGFSVSTNQSTAKTTLESSNSAVCKTGKWTAALNLSSISDSTLTLYADNTVDTGQKSLQKSLSLIKDTTLPSITLTTTSSSPTNTSPIPVTATFSESVTGFSLTDITVTNGTAANLSGSGSVYTFNVYPFVNGSVTATITSSTVTDAGGNANTASSALAVTFNSAAPTVTMTSSTNSATSTSPVPVTVTFSAAVTGFIAADVTLANASISNFAGSGTTYTFDATPSTQGAVTIDISSGMATNTAGSGNLAAAQLVRTYDTTSPTVAITSTVSSTATNQTPFPMTVTFSEAVTNFIVTDLTISNGTASSFAGSGTTYTMNVTPTGNGVVTVDVGGGVAGDAAGNSNTAAAQFSKTYDGTPPTISVSAPAAASYVNNGNLTALTVAGSCSENTRDVTVAVSDGSTTANPGAGVTCATGSSPNWTTTVNTTSLSNGTLSIIATHMDAAGNSTSSTNVAVTKDSSNPNASTSLGWSQSSPTTATSLTAAWTVSNSSDLATQAVQFYSGAACNTTSGSLTAIASSVTATASYTAASEGYYTYKITSYDTAGNSTVSACSSSSTVATTAVTANSTVTGTSPVTANGSSTSAVTITLKNTNNDAVVGVTPTFSATNTGTTNSYAACSATNSSGVSTCTMTSTKAEDKTLSIATPISKADGTVTFQAGAAASVVFTSQPPDGYATVALSTQPIITILDANTNTVTSGADATATVTMTLQSGTGSLAGTVSMSAVSGVANFSGKGLNLSDTGAKTLRATKSPTTGSGGVAALTVDSSSFTISVAPPVLSTQSSQNFPSSPLSQGSAFTKDFNNTNTNDDTGMTYACTFDQVVDGAVAAATACTSLVGTASFSTSTGVMSWTPDYSVFGSFEIKVTGTNAAGTATRIFVIDVRPVYVTTNLIGNWDTQFADLTSSVTGSNLTWKDLTTNGYDGTISSNTNASWAGAGTYSSPYSLNFNGSGKVDFGGTVGNSSAKMMFSSWVNPSNVSSSSDAVIIGNSGNATGNGFTVRQKPSYRDVVMSLNPVGYWRLGEATGTTAVDLGSGGNNGTYTNGPTLAQAGGLSADEDKSVSFDGTSKYVESQNVTGISGNLTSSISMWLKLNSTATAYCAAMLGNGGLALGGFGIYVNVNGAGSIGIEFFGNNGMRTSSGILSAGTWYHIVATKTSGAVNTSTNLYVNGVSQSFSVTSSNTPNVANSYFNIGRYGGGGSGGNYFDGVIDEVSLFNTALTSAQIASLYQAGTTGKKMDFVIGKSYNDVVLADSPVGYWRLGESSGTTAKDLSGNGLNGTYQSSPTLASAGLISGDTDKSVTMNGSTNYITVSHPNTAMSGTISAEAWYKSSNTSIGEQHILSKFPGSDTNYYFGIYQNKVEMAVTGNAYMQSTSTLSNNVLYHLVATYDLSNIRFYINGILDRTVANTATPVSAGTLLNIGRYSGGNSYVFGALDEVALYNYVLTDGQVLTHYNAGLGTYGGTCTSTSGFPSSTWNSIAGLFNGSTASFYVNGRQGCTVSSVPQTLSSASTNLTVGSTSSGTKGWVGYLADLLLYGTSDGSTVGTAANIKTNFDATADRYRQNPVGNIVTSGLVLNLDAANANQALRPYTNGCASTDLSWFDLSSSALTGSLTNFATCGTTAGWNGAGISTDSYRLNFDGTDDYVNVIDSSTLRMVGGGTISMWVNPTTLKSYGNLIWKANFPSNGYGIITLSNGDVQWQVAPNASNPAMGAGTLVNGSWAHITVTHDSGSNVVMYKNGAALTTATAVGSVISGTSNLNIGGDTNNTRYFNGIIATVMMYNRVLSQAEISQNCKAQQSRYSGVTCN